MLSNNLMSYCLNFFVYVKIIMMNLDTAIDTFLSPIADKISGIIFSSVTIHGVKIEFFGRSVDVRCILFYIQNQIYWCLGI